MDKEILSTAGKVTPFLNSVPLDVKNLLIFFNSKTVSLIILSFKCYVFFYV